MLNSLTSTLTTLTNQYNAQAVHRSRLSGCRIHRDHHQLPALGQLHLSRLGQPVDAPLLNGLQFMAAYTFSHDIDDSTAEVFSTYTTPRRPQDIRNLRADRSSSALDHRHRLTYQVLYETPWFKSSKNWAMKNLVGNWEIAPIYTYQTGTWFTVQSGLDSNLNGDSAGDRAAVNAGGNPLIGTGTTALKNSAGATVAFLVNNPAAGYVTAPKGTLPTSRPQYRAHEPDQRHRCHVRQERHDQRKV